MSRKPCFYIFLILKEVYQLPVFERSVSSGIIIHGLHFVELHFLNLTFIMYSCWLFPNAHFLPVEMIGQLLCHFLNVVCHIH